MTLKVEIDLMSGESSGKIAEEANILLRREGFLKEGESLGMAEKVMTEPRILDYIASKVKQLNSENVVSRAAQIRKWVILPAFRLPSSSDFKTINNHST